MKFTSLTQRFMVWFAAVSLLPIMLAGYGLLRVFETELQKTAIQQVSPSQIKKSSRSMVTCVNGFSIPE